MTWQQPFVDLVSVLDRSLPDRLRGVTVARLDTDPAQLPPKARVRLDLDPAAVLWREIPRADVPPDMTADRRIAWTEARLETLSPWAQGAYLWAEAGFTAGGGGDKGDVLRLALTAAAPIRAVETRLRETGRRLAEVQLGPLRLSLDAEGKARRVRLWTVAWLAAMGLAVTLAGVALWQIRTATDAADLARQRLARVAADTAAQSDRSKAILALAGQGAAAGLTAPLNRLAASLPTDSYLLTLRLTPDEFQIAGQSSAVDAIVPALQAGGFDGVDFAGGSALDAATGLYSFTIHGRTGGAR